MLTAVVSTLGMLTACGAKPIDNTPQEAVRFTPVPHLEKTFAPYEVLHADSKGGPSVFLPEASVWPVGERIRLRVYCKGQVEPLRVEYDGKELLRMPCTTPQTKVFELGESRSIQIKTSRYSTWKIQVNWVDAPQKPQSSQHATPAGTTTTSPASD